MHEIVEATAQLCRRHPADEIDRPAARLALLTVVDHLDAALTPSEIAVLVGALPLGLSLMLQRRAGTERTQFELVDETALRTVCEVLAREVGGDVARRLREEVPEVLLGRRERLVERGPSAAARGPQRPSCRPTMQVPTMDARPTLRVTGTPPRSAVRVALRPTAVLPPHVRPEDLRTASTRDDVRAVGRRPPHAA